VLCTLFVLIFKSAIANIIKIAERNEQGMDSGCHRHRPCDTTAPNAALALIIVGRGHLETQSSYVVRADLMEEKPN